MDKKLYEVADLEVWERGGRFFIRYNAGSHQIVMREDEISEADARAAMGGPEAAMKVLFALQERLTRAGIDAYVSNVKN